LPFPLLGFDTDNGSEFINHEVLEYCDDNKITFTRSRAYRKNDQAHVEHKKDPLCDEPLDTIDSKDKPRGNH
jgi:hypothetical protein